MWVWVGAAIFVLINKIWCMWYEMSMISVASWKLVYVVMLMWFYLFLTYYLLLLTYLVVFTYLYILLVDFDGQKTSLNSWIAKFVKGIHDEWKQTTIV